MEGPNSLHVQDTGNPDQLDHELQLRNQLHFQVAAESRSKQVSLESTCIMLFP